MAGIAVTLGVASLGPLGTHFRSRFVETETQPIAVAASQRNVPDGTAQSARLDAADVLADEAQTDEPANERDGAVQPRSFWDKASIALQAILEAVEELPEHFATEASNLRDALPTLIEYAKEHPFDAATTIGYAFAAGTILDLMDKAQHASAIAQAWYADDDDGLRREMKVLANGVALAAIMRAGVGSGAKRAEKLGAQRKGLVRQLNFRNGLQHNEWNQHLQRAKTWAANGAHERPPFRGATSINWTKDEKFASTVLVHWMRDENSGKYVVDAAARVIPRQDSWRIDFIGYFDRDGGRAIVSRAAANSRAATELRGPRYGRLTAHAEDPATNAFLRELGFVPVVPELGNRSVLAVSADTADAIIRKKNVPRPDANEWTHGLGLAERQAIRVEQLSPGLRDDLAAAINHHPGIPMRFEYVRDYDGPLVVPENPVGSIRVNPDRLPSDDHLMLRIAEEVGEIRSGKRELEEQLARLQSGHAVELKGRNEQEFIAMSMRQEIEVNAQTILYYLQRRDELQTVLGRELPNHYPDYQSFYQRFKHDNETALGLIGDQWAAQLASDGRENLLVAQTRYEGIWRRYHSPQQRAEVMNAERYLAPRLPDPNTARPRHEMFEVHDTERDRIPREPPNLN